ncbi:uncharacterized protein LOC111074497 [Drosophila obscura]|uniref:uncharacterized protein LOC111074497 n=1 Tax=Drosophila obscura TaxID=7282 RepID=UPI001BB264B3|nr:uncharacterized protein LOC111074497 [Drosophila obscura]
MVNFISIFGILTVLVFGFFVFWKLGNVFRCGFIYALDCVLYRVWLAIYWPPDDFHRAADCHRHPCQECQAQRLVQRIERAKASVFVILHTTSHKGLCKALMQAHLRGLDVGIVGRPQELTARDLMLKQLFTFGQSVRQSPWMRIIKFASIDNKHQFFLLDPEILLLVQYSLVRRNRFGVLELSNVAPAA